MRSILGVALLTPIHYQPAYSAPWVSEPVQACVVARDADLTAALRAHYAHCLGWQATKSTSLCLGTYTPIIVHPLSNNDELQITADSVSLYRNQRSKLSGHVEIQQAQRIVNAQTAYIYRDAKTDQITKVEFLGEVRYLEPGRLMIARTATMNPQDRSGQVYDVLYRFNSEQRHHAAALPAWGQAKMIQRFSNKDYLLKQATYSTCAPQDKAWSLEAKSIKINDAKARGVARDAVLRIREWPVLYTPYLSFPTNKERKSGFLMPLAGYSNVSGWDFGTPYYWNIAPNYDMTITPHVYSERGVMLGDEFRFLSTNSVGLIKGSFLPHDKLFHRFILDHETEFPQLQGNSTNRWAVGVADTTHFSSNLSLHLSAEQVSDNYYLQDFSTNLAQITQRQLLRQADLTYTTEHWLFRGMGQSYQTLHPVNEPPIDSVYERLPQLMAQGFYSELPLNARFSVLGQYDQFHWPSDFWNADARPQGPRFHLNPVLSVPFVKSWGFVTPEVQFIENYYQIDQGGRFPSDNFNRTIPRYSVDSGLYLERNFSLNKHRMTQTLEPRLFYLNVPYYNQAAIPIFDSGTMIFNVDQLFRTNRFSGFDRIGDANQLTYAVTSRWLMDETGMEKANFSLGQIKYFSDRRVQLCQSPTGYCVADPLSIGYLSPTYGVSPVASQATYHFNSNWRLSSDYIWNPATKATNNADLNVAYSPLPNAVLTAGYSYLVNADVTQVRQSMDQNNALHQAIVSYSLPVNERWSTLGAYSQNISKNYSMMSLFGVQYDSCCWAMRLLGGRTFKNLNANFEPRYNNNVYLQIALKGLGSVGNSDPYNTLNTYIPGYKDPFHG